MLNTPAASAEVVQAGERTCWQVGGGEIPPILSGKGPLYFFPFFFFGQHVGATEDGERRGSAWQEPSQAHSQEQTLPAHLLYLFEGEGGEGKGVARA